MSEGLDARWRGGFTLIELTVAASIFLVVMGFTAQALVEYYAAMDLTQQRTEAAQNCASVISQMRAVRNANPEAFPGSILERWPQGETLSTNQSVFSEDDARPTTLPDEELTVEYVDDAGNLLTGEELRSSILLRVRVTSRWQTLRGRAAQTSVTTLLTNG